MSGNPVSWIDIEHAIHHYATNQVVFDMGETLATYHGGWNKSGIRSVLSTKSIIAVTGEAPHRKPYASLTDNSYLFRRDRNVCAYCGESFKDMDLTRDHIHPKSKGGKDDWMNLVTSCRSCNRRKGNKVLSEIDMQLLYVPYRPTRWEGFILSNRKILVDQMEYLAAKLPKDSRWAI
jgi:5-methylcytosine-specific restriction endonuclease McrA